MIKRLVVLLLSQLLPSLFLVAQPTNDDCANAIMLYAGSDGLANAVVNLNNATYDPSYEDCDGSMQPGIWYRFIAESGNFIVVTQDPTGACIDDEESDSELLIATGTNCDDLSVISMIASNACQDQDNTFECDAYPFCERCDFNEFFQGSVNPGTSVFVMVKRNDDDSDLQYDLIIQGAPTNDVPTLSQWSLIILGLFLTIFSVNAVRQRHIQPI